MGYAHGGGGDTLSEAGETYVAEVQASEAEFMVGLAEGLANGDVSEAQGLARARQYARRIRGTANEAFRESSSGFKLTWVLGATDHCAECPQYAGMSPWEPDEAFASPGDGSTPCGGACDCKWVRSDGREGFARYEFD